MTMSNLHDTYPRNHYPDVPASAELTIGRTLTGSQAEAIGSLIGTKLTSLSRQPELSTAEVDFVAWSADLTAQNLIMLNRRGVPFSPEMALELKKQADNFAVNSGIKAQAEIEPANEIDVNGAVQRSINVFTDNTAANQLRSRPYLRSNVEDFGALAAPVFGGMVRSAGGVELDRQLSVNLQNMLALYEAAEQHRAA